MKGTLNQKIQELEKESKEIFNLLLNTDEEYLREYLVYLFNDRNKCSDYAVINKYILKNRSLEIEYDKDKIINTYVPWFRYLNTLQASSYYAYDFQKEQPHKN